MIVEIRKIKKRPQSGLFYTFNVLNIFGVKTSPGRDVKRYYLQKKWATIRDFIKALVIITWYS